MIRTIRKEDLEAVMALWLEMNLKAHDFIPTTFWKTHYEMVKESIMAAEVYVYVEDRIVGFIGLVDDYVAGLFVTASKQSKGIGTALLDIAKSKHGKLSLHVYEKNKKAMTFYKNQGFQISKYEKDEATDEMNYQMIWQYFEIEE